MITCPNGPNGLAVVMFRDQLPSGRDSAQGTLNNIFVYASVYLEQFSWLCVCINDQNVGPRVFIAQSLLYYYIAIAKK